MLDAAVGISDISGGRVEPRSISAKPTLSSGSSLAHPVSSRPLTIAEVAERWQCSRDTVRNRIRTGALKCLRLSARMVRVLPEHIAEYEQTAHLGSSLQAGPATDRRTGLSTGKSETQTANLVRGAGRLVRVTRP